MKIDKITAIVSMIFLVLALCVIVITPSASSYEISIYGAYPWYFWVFICISIAFGVISLVKRTFWPSEESNWWKISVYTIIFTNLMITLLPVFRGYYLPNGGDLVIHLGYIKDITLNGHFGSDNYYPLSHILSATLNFTTGLDFVSIIKILPPVFFILYMVGLYLTTKAFGGKTEHATLVMAFGSVPLFLTFNNTYLPTHFFVLLLPLILMLLIKTATADFKAGYIAFLVLILIAMPFLHPYESIFLIVIFLIYAVSVGLFKLLTRKADHLDTIKKYPLYMSLISALVVSGVFILWFYHFDLFNRAINLFRDLWAYGFRGQSVAGNLTDQIQSANLSSLDFVLLLIKRYGHQLLICLLSLISILMIFRKIFKNRDNLNANEIFFALIFSAFTFLYLLSLIGLSFGTGDSPRILNHGLIAGVILIVLIFYDWYSRNSQFNFNKSKIGIYTITIIIIVSGVLGIFTVHSSPYTFASNTQVTRMQWYGLQWFCLNKNDSATIYLEEITRRMPAAVFGPEELSNMTLGPFFIGEKHFGYDISETLGSVYSSTNTYIVISERNRAIYTLLFPDIGHYSINDFEKLKLDPALSRVYYNGDLEIWQIHRS